jgi:hypothetical protein
MVVTLVLDFRAGYVLSVTVDIRNKRAACRDGTSADGERNNSACGAKMPHSTQILCNDREWDTGATR